MWLPITLQARANQNNLQGRHAQTTMPELPSIRPHKLPYLPVDHNRLPFMIVYPLPFIIHIKLLQPMTDNKGMQMIDKLTRHHIFNSRYWKQECFALNAETFIDKAVQIKYIGGLYSGAKKPTKFLCLVFKLLQMNLPKEIAIEYLRARDYKYLNAIALFYLRLVLRGVEVYETLEPFLNDNRKLRLRNMIGEFSIVYIDELIDGLLREETWMGISLPFLPKRAALEEQGTLEPRVSMLEQEDDQKGEPEGQEQVQAEQN